MNTRDSDREKQLGQLGERFSLIAKAMHGKYGSALVCTTPVLDKVILIIGAEKQINIKHISELLLVTSGAATQHVTALEELGIISRHVGQEDRREISVRLTDKGAEMYRQIKVNYLQALGEAFADLDAVELQALLELMTKASNKYRTIQNKGATV